MTSHTTEGGRAPGPSVGSLATMLPRLVRTDVVDVAVSLRDRYGHVVRIPPVYPGLDAPAYLVTHPDDVRYVLQSHAGSFRGLDVSGASAFSTVVTDSVVSLTEDSDEGSWLARLRKLSPEFRRDAVAAHAPAIAGTTVSTLAEYDAVGARDAQSGRVPESIRVDENGTVRLLPAMQRLSLRLLGASLFGPDLRAHEETVVGAVADLRRAYGRKFLAVGLGALTKRVPESLPVPSALQGLLGTSVGVPLVAGQEMRVESAVERLHDVADAVARRRVRTPRVYDDALATWLSRPDPVTGETLDPATLRREVVGLLLAGFGTLSAALTWTVFLAATRPAVQDRIAEEAAESRLFAPLDDVRDTGQESETADADALRSDLAYTHRVWRETLRLYPTLPVWGRTAREPVTLGGYRVPADAPVLVSPYVTHRDPAFWDAPERFDPSRFAPDRERDRPEFAYYPFSGGSHACLGEALATVEATVALAALFRTYRVRLVGVGDGDSPDDQPRVGVDSAINLQPDREIRVRFEPR